jgi:hypothetical protein
MGRNRTYELQNKYLYEIIKRTLLNKPQQETILKFYTTLAVPAVTWQWQLDLN